MIRVVVVNWNAADLTSRCLRSLEATDWPREDLDLVVVDNGSIDGSLQIIRRRHPDCRVIANGENLGFAEACNRAMADLDGIEHVALVNNDTEVDPGWLAPMVQVMADDPEVGAVSPRMVFDRWFHEVEVTVDGDGDRARLTEVRVDGSDRTSAVLCGDGVVRPPHPSIPLRLEIEVAARGTLLIPVASAASADAVAMEMVFDTERPVTIRCGDVSTAAAPVDRAVRLAITPTGAPGRRINSLGTALTEWCEGYERRLGEPDDAELHAETVDGWTGGGVLLRAAVLDDVGRFDPTFFMYYEDTDLSWRMRRAGWITRTCPDSVILHRLGGSAGSSWSGFFFLNYRNWLLTVFRNGSRSEVRRALRAAWGNSWPFARRNVVGRVRRFRRPDTDIAGRWVRVALGTLAALPRTLGARPLRTGRLLGRTPVDSVGSAFLTLSDPAPPRPETGGPTLVYVDVTDTIASRWRAGIQRAVTEVVSRLILDHPELSVVLIRWSTLDHAYRRLDPTETDSFFDPPPMPNHPPAAGPPPPSVGRRVVSRVAAIGPIRRRIDERRRRSARRRRPAQHDALVIDRFEAGTVFFDPDASWNLGDIPRRRLYPELRAGGTRVVTLLHDILPVTHPRWFDPNLARVFSSHVDAAIAGADTIITSSRFSAAEISAAAHDRGRRDLAVETCPLGSDPSGRSDDPADATLMDTLADRPVILCVGTLEPRKNHAGLLDAFDRLDAEATLVIVGRQGWRIDPLAERIRTHPLFGERLVWPSEVNDTTLARLYALANVVAVPSFAEGFGLPVVEALRHGCRVVSSDGGSLGEVGGDAVTYVDPTDPTAFAEALDGALAERGRPGVPVGLPAWDETADQVAAVLRGVSLRR